jgi:hypothetical protein
MPATRDRLPLRHVRTRIRPDSAHLVTDQVSDSPPGAVTTAATSTLGPTQPIDPH